MLLRIIILLMMLAILASLGSALMFMFRRGKNQDRNMVRALTWRVGLSVTLFLLLMAGFYFGVITPTGFTPR